MSSHSPNEQQDWKSYPNGPVDMHVHLVGNGSGGTGCWLRLRGAHRLLARYMVGRIGLPASALNGDLEHLFLQNLLQLVRQSSLQSVVVLAHDLVHDMEGRPLPDLGSFYVPNKYVLTLAKRHPELLPGVSIHPARPDALEELNRCVQAGAVLVKILPNCHNIDCADRRLTKFWELMAEAGIPLLAHTGGEHTVPVVQAAYADPRILTRPLEIGVTVIAAHCGTRSGLFDPDYFHDFVEMTRVHPNLYGDISAFTLPIRGRHVRECLEAPLCHRLLHGSDFPVPVIGSPWRWSGVISRDHWARCRAISNPLERDYQLKRAAGFPEETFTRFWSLIRKKKPGLSVRGCPEARGISN